MSGAAGPPLADPVAEARRLIALAGAHGITMRALGGVAVILQSPGGQPRLSRRVKDIDLAVGQGAGRPAARLLARSGYLADEMFNALRGSSRLHFRDPANGRDLDVFVGQFSMCHAIPLTARLDRDPLTVPLEELLLTKLQIVELTANDQQDIYNLLLAHEVGEQEAAITAGFIAALCARDWGLWRTCTLTIERSRANLERSPLSADERRLVAVRLDALRDRIDAEPKAVRWRARSRLGDLVRWYDEPEEER